MTNYPEWDVLEETIRRRKRHEDHFDGTTVPNGHNYMGSEAHEQGFEESMATHTRNSETGCTGFKMALIAMCGFIVGLGFALII